MSAVGNDSRPWVVPQSIKWLSTTTRERRIHPDSESGGIPHLFGTSLSPHIGSAWWARHNNNNNNTIKQFFVSSYSYLNCADGRLKHFHNVAEMSYKTKTVSCKTKTGEKVTVERNAFLLIFVWLQLCGRLQQNKIHPSRRWPPL